MAPSALIRWRRLRANEASRVGAVLERKAAGDVPGMIAAAVELWVTPIERRPDDATQEVWAALREAGALDAAVGAALRLVEAGQRIRPRVFLDVVEAIASPDRLVELAGQMIELGWPPEPYLMATFGRLIRLGHDGALWSFVQAHRARLAADVESWTAVAYVLTTCDLGSPALVDHWFVDWETRKVPMWVLAAYLARLAGGTVDRTRELVALARTVYARCDWDATASYFVSYLAIGDLLDGDLVAFQARARSAAISGAPRPEDNPIVRYHDGLGAPLAVATRLAELLARNDRIVGLFAEMIALPPGDTRGATLYREMARARPGELPLLRPIWRRLARARLGWLARVRLDYF